MAATTSVVYTETQTQTFMDDTKLNPVSNEKRGEVHITLTFDGVSIDPALIFDALQTLGTVQSNLVPTHKNYNFIIT